MGQCRRFGRGNGNGQVDENLEKAARGRECRRQRAGDGNEQRDVGAEQQQRRERQDEGRRHDRPIALRRPLDLEQRGEHRAGGQTRKDRDPGRLRPPAVQRRHDDGGEDAGQTEKSRGRRFCAQTYC